MREIATVDVLRSLTSVTGFSLGLRAAGLQSFEGAILPLPSPPRIS
jgi:hypothetical protein